MKVKFVYIFYVLLFLLLFTFTLNFNFIEGDDASTVVYHLLGRDKGIQLPYSSYHSMFDAFLGLFNANNEWVLRHVSIGVSFLFGLFMLWSLCYLIFLKSKQDTKSISIVLMALPFIIPEVLFGSLIVNPTLISMTCILIAHIWMLKYMQSNAKLEILVAVICFGIGVSFRWNNGFYLFLLFADFILREQPKGKDVFELHRIKQSIVIFTLFVLSVVLCIQLSGYSLLDVFNTYTNGASYVETMETSYTAMFATALAFLTPALLLLFFFGILYAFKNKAYRNILILLFTLIPFAVVGFYPSYKYMISIIPIVILIAIQGYAFVQKKSIKIVLAVMVCLPWVFGLQLQANSAWGPGFELKIKTVANKDLDNYNPDSNLSMSHFKVLFGSGMAMPTPEGPRPIYGFAHVLINDWYDFVDIRNEERLDVVQYAIDKDYDILQDVRHSFMVSKLIELGYTTKDPFTKNDFNVYTRLFAKEKDTVTIKVFSDKNQLFKSKNIENGLIGSEKIVVFSSYSNIVSKLTSTFKYKFEQKSPFWGVLDIE